MTVPTQSYRKLRRYLEQQEARCEQEWRARGGDRETTTTASWWAGRAAGYGEAIDLLTQLDDAL